MNAHFRDLARTSQMKDDELIETLFLEKILEPSRDPQKGCHTRKTAFLGLARMPRHTSIKSPSELITKQPVKPLVL